MRIIAGVFAAVVLLGGCANRERVRHSNFVPHEFKSSVSSFLPLEAAAKICAREFPDALNPQDDGDNNFTVQNTVNVKMSTPTNAVVCSINGTTGALERIHDGSRVISIEEINEKRAAAYALTRAIQSDVDLIENGRSAEFVKRAKRFLSDQFKDPDSVKFRDLILSNRTSPALCGQLNAKNSYGGYVGYRPFVYSAAGTQISDDKDIDIERKFLKLRLNSCSNKFADAE